MLAILLFLIFLDQLSKYLIRYYDGFYICNSGIAFGIALPHWLLTPVAILLIFFILLFLKSQKSHSILSQITPVNRQHKLQQKKPYHPSHPSHSTGQVPTRQVPIWQGFLLSTTSSQSSQSFDGTSSDGTSSDMASFLLILAGAISNLIDRLLHGCVVDFIDIKIFNYPFFNFADTFIVIGASLLIFKILFNKK